MKMRYVFMAVLADLALALPTQAAPGTGYVSLGITNASFATSVGATQMGQGTAGGDALKYNNNCTLMLSSTACTNSSATNCVVVLARTDSTGTAETATFTWNPQVPASQAGTFLVMTNIPQSFLGAASGLNLIAFTNWCSGSMINPVLKIEVKNLLAPN